MGVALKRPYLDIGITVHKRKADGSIEIIGNKDLTVDR